MCHWWSGSDCTLRLENESDLAMIGKEHVITLMNHKYDIDWLMAWTLAERLQMLGVNIDHASLRSVTDVGQCMQVGQRM